jgi:inosine-uridine nucleoside N-ribohydrolase
MRIPDSVGGTATGAMALALIAAMAVAGSSPQARAAEKPARIPVILDTDIGDDIDDTWALLMALRSPEIDLRLITVDYGSTHYRARLLAKLLEAAGRTDIPIGIGPKQAEGEGNQAEWARGYELSQYKGTVHQDGVKALVDTIMGSSVPMTLLCVGPVPNIQAALAREPRIAERARFVGMHGSLRRGYGGKAEPEAEWNVKANAAACRSALSAGWDVTITPLDTCGLVQLRGERYARIRDSRDPFARILMENYRIWHTKASWTDKDPKAPDRESSTLFDTVAVYLTFGQDLLKMEDLGVAVRDDGFTILDPKAKVLRCATAWKDMAAFEELLVSRIAGR